jgi:hypothetical protein
MSGQDELFVGGDGCLAALAGAVRRGDRARINAFDVRECH